MNSLLLISPDQAWGFKPILSGKPKEDLRTLPHQPGFFTDIADVEGRRKKEEGRRKKEEGRRKKEEN
ncbi:hypothetical protein [Microcoleus sp. N9_A1]|uniref:hypothetical protein n=1 Tax=Microcoleus sp. N9_A1 TaxID=3055380 RepID=UPI002FD5BB87